MKFPEQPPTYKQQYDKIVDAYFKNELNPYDPHQCFIGNMFDNTCVWSRGRVIVHETNLLTGTERTIWTKDPMQILEILGFGGALNLVFLGPVSIAAVSELSCGLYEYDDIEKLECNFLEVFRKGGETEDSLFEAMSSTLDILKEIHANSGEQVDVPTFKKRDNKGVLFVKKEGVHC